MKKITLFILLICSSFGFAQQYVDVLPGAATSQNGRAPQGVFRYTRTCYVISPAEMTASGLPNSTVLSALSFKYSVAQDIATTGTLKIYVENSNDATYLKASTSWATTISTMTKVHDATNTIPAAIGFWNIAFTGGSPFTYTGGGVYVAFEYENAIDPLATVANTADCSTAINAGLRNVFGATSQGADLTNSSNWRPYTRFGYAAACLSPSAVVISNVTTTSATVAFTAPATIPGSGYEYYLSTSNVAPTAATSATGTAGTTTFNLTSLLPTSTYYVWVRSACSASSKSVWTVATTILTNATVPYSYGFEDPLQPGFTLFNAGTGNNWSIGSAAGLAATGTTYATYIYNSTMPANAWMFSRSIQLAAGTQYTVSFKVRARDEGTPPVYPESMKATIGNANTVAAQTNLLWDSGVDGVNYIIYTPQSGTFTPTVAGPYVIGFNCYSSANQFQLLLDDIEISSALSITKNELTENDVTLAPVPVYDNFTVKIDNNIAVQQVSIVDVNGRVVRTFDKQLNNYNISDLSPGVYVVSIKSEYNTVYKKIIKN